VQACPRPVRVGGIRPPVSPRLPPAWTAPVRPGGGSTPSSGKGVLSELGVDPQLGKRPMLQGVGRPPARARVRWPSWGSTTSREVVPTSCTRLDR